MGGGSPIVFISTSMRSCHAAGGSTLTAALITSGYAIILTNMDSPELYFRATTFVSGYSTKDATVA